ncbi:MAG: hypothetical protein IKE22_00580 [Atopobiaceae bacterium]|nr:hypothetical protein [Atopobiaceae bacterium]
MRFFTADLHLGDKTIARWRGFGEDVAAHDEMILAGLVERLTHDDDIWLLGDLCKARVDDVVQLRKAIPCRRVHVIVGNHDSRSKFVTCGLFDSVEYYGQIGRVRADGYKFVMSHYPMLDWDRAYHGAYMLHGHIHSLPLEPGELAQPLSSELGGMGIRGYNEWNAAHGIRRFDVGVDANDYRPVSAEDIVASLPSNEEWSALHGLPVD